MNIDKNYRKLRKKTNPLGCIFKKYSLINKLNNLISNNTIIELFLDFNLGTSLESK